MINSQFEQYDVFVAELDAKTLDVIRTSVFTDVEQFQSVYRDTFHETSKEDLEEILGRFPTYRMLELKNPKDPAHLYLMMLGKELSTFNIALDRIVERRKATARLSTEELVELIESQLCDETMEELTDSLGIADPDQLMEAITAVLKKAAETGSLEFYLYPITVGLMDGTDREEIMLVDENVAEVDFGINLVDYLAD